MIKEIIGKIHSNSKDFNNSQRYYEFLLFFEDIEGNKYKQFISKGNVEKPERIE